MIIFIFSIVLSILNFLVVCLPGDLPIFGYLLVKIVSLLITVVSIILVITHKGKDKLEVASLIILLLLAVFSYRGYSLARNYSESVKGLNEEFGNNYKIVGITKRNFSNCYNPYNYAFNVKLKDNSNIIFQSQYCSSGVEISIYRPNDNYELYYVPYYLKKFNNTNKTNLTYEINDEDQITIKFNDSDRENLIEFLDYLYTNDYDARYQITLYSIDEERLVGYANSWNNDYKSILRMRNY